VGGETELGCWGGLFGRCRRLRGCRRGHRGGGVRFGRGFGWFGSFLRRGRR
jgi:hypothetical protein